ncbi:MAG: hypothetical protein HOF24_10265 [Flavobacteriaceae bacterium]|jgi:type I restriction enzyme S subunit|nr:hypothetical protein [bacterium]MBT3920752.1 hypothetical protein [Flavobacteriaceae bacterium]
MWKTVKLDDLIEIQNGYAFDSKKFSPQGKMPLIRIRDLKGGSDTQTRYTGDYDTKFIIKKGDFLIGMDGEFRCYEWKGPIALLNQRVCRLQNFKEKLYRRYLFYVINDELIKIEKNTGFTTVKHISSKKINEIRLSLPPLEEQKQIVKKLDATFAEIDKNIENLKNKKEQVESLVNRVLEEELKNAEGENVKLGDLCQNLDRLRKPITKKNRRSGIFPYYGASGVVDYVDDYLFDQKLVLVGEDGAKWGAGSSTSFIINGKSWVNNHVHVLKPNSEVVMHEWITYYLNSINLQPWITGLTVEKLNQEKLSSIPIPLPPIQEQKQIVKKLDAVNIEKDSSINALNSQIDNYIALKSSILFNSLKSPSL